MFSGECKYSSPEAYNSNYFGVTNKAAALFGDPAQPQPQPATIYEPPFNVRVMNLSSTTFLDTNMMVYAKLQKPSTSTESCDEDSYRLYGMGWGAGSAASWGTVPRTSGTYPNHWLSSASNSFDPGMPFGKYRFCVIDTEKKKYSVTGTDYDNTSVNGGAALDIAPSGWTSYSTTTPGPSTCGFTS
jgi:hypothetical protein